MRAPAISGLAALAIVASGCGLGSSSTHPTTRATASGANCAVSRARPARNFPQSAAGFAVGPGPAYADFDVTPTPRLTGDGRIGVIHYGTPVNHGQHYAKTLWIIAPTVHSRVLVTGAKVGEPGSRVRFALGGSRSTPVLRLQGGSSWADMSSGLLFPGPGCYALRVQLPSRSYTITVRAER